MTTARQFWTTKSPLAQYHALAFEHPAFDAPFRLVANQYAEVTLDGHVHTPAPMKIKPPGQDSDAQHTLRAIFPRAVVGRAFKQQLKLIRQSDSRTPISVTYSVYLGVASSPQVTWELYVAEESGVQFSVDAVQVNATFDNPMLRPVGTIYDPATFTGLEIIQ